MARVTVEFGGTTFTRNTSDTRNEWKVEDSTGQCHTDFVALKRTGTFGCNHEGSGAWIERDGPCPHLAAFKAAVEAGAITFEEKTTKAKGGYSNTICASLTSKGTYAQRSRQGARGNDGKYTKHFPCYICGKSAGVEYYSAEHTDGVDSEGNHWNDLALVLCKRCADRLRGLPDGKAFAVASSGMEWTGIAYTWPRKARKVR